MTNTIAVRIGSTEGRRVELRGRDAWALLQLVAASARGVTPIERVGPRWSAYVFKLRRAGIAIHTVRESHGGPFPGHHARYVLATSVCVEEPTEAAA